MQWVCYIEIQGLYASVACEAGLVPDGRPIAVLRDGRAFDGCHQAFTSGLVLGTPARQVQRDVPGVALVAFEAIRPQEKAHQWWDYCHTLTPYIEPGELHQVYVALPSPTPALTREVRSEVTGLLAHAQTYGCAAFAGLSAAKFVARAAAQLCKTEWLPGRPGSPRRPLAAEPVRIVPPGEEERFLAPLPIAWLPAPSDVQRRLLRLGIRSIGEAARIPEGEWLRQLGPRGKEITHWSRGIDPESVKPSYPPRILSERVTFSTETSARDMLERLAVRAAAHLVDKLVAEGEGCQQISLLLERVGAPPLRAVRTLQRLQQGLFPVQQAVQTLLGEVLQASASEATGGVRATAVQVELGLIGPMPWQQMDLWDDRGQFEREERLRQVLSLLHQRFPSRVVGLGAVQPVPFREQMLQFHDPYRWEASAR